MRIGLPPDADAENLRTHAISLLDAARHAYESARHNRIRYMHLGREYGLTYDEIGEALGLSGSAVRMAIQRASDAA